YLSGVSNPETRFYRIFYATSNDGLNWTKQNNTVYTASDVNSGNYQLYNGTPFAGDSFGPIASFVLNEGAANTYSMWYSGLAGGSVSRIYRASTTDGGQTWTKQNNAIPARSDSAGSNGRLPLGVATAGD